MPINQDIENLKLRIKEKRLKYEKYKRQNSNILAALMKQEGALAKKALDRLLTYGR